MRLRQDGHDVSLVFTGPRSDSRSEGYGAELASLIAEAGPAIIELGVLPRAEQIAIFRHAGAIIQPSLFEGWSTVVEDARALGKPMIMSDLAVHVEQAVPGGSFFRRGDPASLAEAISRRRTEFEQGLDEVRERDAAERQIARCRAAAEAFVQILSAERDRRQDSKGF
jgi:glycosyltransferase involved in cell wall biosynthesis